MKSDGLNNYKDSLVIVTTATGEPDAVQYMKKLGMIQGLDYFTFSMIN